MTSFITTVYVTRYFSILAGPNPTDACHATQDFCHDTYLPIACRLANAAKTTSNNNRRNQFRPRPGGKPGATSYQLRQYAEATLGGGSLRKIVKLPEGEDENEWFAVNSKPSLALDSSYPRCTLPTRCDNSLNADFCSLVVDFYNQINLLYGAITEFCSPQSCPEMKATDECEQPG